MSEEQATYETEAGCIEASPDADVMVVNLRGMTDAERSKLRQEVQSYEHRRRARERYERFRPRHNRDWPAFEEAAEALPFGARQVQRIVKGY